MSDHEGNPDPGKHGPEAVNGEHGTSGTSGIVDVGFARLDIARQQRTGDPEVVYGAGKTPEQVVVALRVLAAHHPEGAVLATRLDEATRAAIRADLPEADVNDIARTATLGTPVQPRGRVLVVAAGTVDAPVATEAAISARVYGAGVEQITDVGVAGLHRVLAIRDQLAAADALIVVAGMEGALPSVIGGMTGVPLVAVPTSTGYGTGAGGIAALVAMLNSCAPGVVVVNVDNGYGAGVHAARIARRICQ
ncbi:MAG: nickel pincer cofactor biosynthesis protein LarB [Actinomycetota bacterium]